MNEPIRARLERIENDCVMPDRYRGEEYALELTKALYAVLDLHEVDRNTLSWSHPACEWCGGDYPCTTVRAVADALGVQRATPLADTPEARIERDHQRMGWTGATPPAEPTMHEFASKLGTVCGHLVDGVNMCGRFADHPVHQQRGERA